MYDVVLRRERTQRSFTVLWFEAGVASKRTMSSVERSPLAELRPLLYTLSSI